MKSEMIKNVVALLKEEPQVSDYKINVCQKESFEVFYVLGKLETLRATDTCDRVVTVYVDHDGFRGDALIQVYPSDTPEILREKVAGAVRNAKLICNAPYALPDAEEGDYVLPSNLDGKPMSALCDEIAGLVFSANTKAGGSLNSVEVFLNHYTESVCNSRGLQKSQARYDAMVEAIPTWNGDKESVELYEQYNFSALDRDTLVAEIAGKMSAVQARYEAQKPGFPMDCPVVLPKQELHELFWSFAQDLNYATVYGHGNLYHKGDRIQTAPTGDSVTITMRGQVEGSVNSSSFDSDGMALGEVVLVKDGLVENYYGSNRFGQYLEETPSGNLRCLCVAPGTAKCQDLGPFLEVMSMSGLQVDLFNDYVGGEIRLARYHDGRGGCIPVTGISVAGKLGQVMNAITLSQDLAIHDGYQGPAAAVLSHMKIF